MSNVKTIHLQPGETAIITMAGLPIKNNETFSISKGAKLINVHRSTLYRAEKEGKIVFDRTGKSPKITHSELLKIKNK
jgi:excisionase family DNA binding protein